MRHTLTSTPRQALRPTLRRCTSALMSLTLAVAILPAAASLPTAIVDAQETGTVTELTLDIQSVSNGSASADITAPKAGDKVTLTATPNTGYKLDGWEVTEGEVTISDDNTFVMPDGNVTLKPLFVRASYSLTLTSNEFGSLSAQVFKDGSDTPTTVTEDSPGEVTYYDKFELQPQPLDENYLFSGYWDVVSGPDEDAAGTDIELYSNKTTFYMPPGDLTLKAVFNGYPCTVIQPMAYYPHYWVNDQGGHGPSISGTGDILKLERADGTVVGETDAEGIWTQEPAIRYGERVRIVPSDDEYLQPTGKYYFYQFSPEQELSEAHPIEVEVDNDGYFTVPSCSDYNNRMLYFYTILKPRDYVVETTATEGGTTQVTAGHVSFQNPDQWANGWTTVVEPDIKVEKVTGATVTRSSEVSLIDLSAVPDKGYEFAGWEVTGGTVLDSEWENKSQDANVTVYVDTGDLSFRAKFTKIDSPLVVATDAVDTAAENGTVTVSDSAPEWGEEVTLTATPEPGYEFTGWKVTEGTVEDLDLTKPETTFTMPQGGAKIEATFAKEDAPLTVVTAKPTVNPDKPDAEPVTPEDTGTVAVSNPEPEWGEKVTLTATPKPGYRFAGWKVTEGTIEKIDLTTPTTTFVMPQGGATVEAVFEEAPPATAPEEGSTGSSELTDGEIAGIVVGIIALLALIGGGAYQWMRTQGLI